MRLNLKQLKHLVVETASGEKLGHIHDLILETEGQLIAGYAVKPSLLSGTGYLISRDQIIRFETTKIIVEDNVIKEKVAKAANPAKASPEPAATRYTL